MWRCHASKRRRTAQAAPPRALYRHRILTAPPARIMRLVQHHDDESASSSSEDEESSESEEEEVEDDAALPERADEAPVAPLAPTGRAPSGKIKLTLSAGSGRCKACGSTAHTAGFQGAVYVDCPDRPCYLCKKARRPLASAALRVACEAPRAPARMRLPGAPVSACGAAPSDKWPHVFAPRSPAIPPRRALSAWRRRRAWRPLAPARARAAGPPAPRCGWRRARRALLRRLQRSTRRRRTGASPPPSSSCTGACSRPRIATQTRRPAFISTPWRPPL